jgi:ADP-L-glycero-D-manno-heptose 6-epimerase
MILVTGGAGFIGSNLVAELDDRGDEIAVCDTLGRDQKWQNLRKRRLAAVIPPAGMFDWLRDNAGRVSAVVHMGAISATTASDADLTVESNFTLSQRLWDWCTVHRVRFVYASSAATYGDGARGFVDDDSSAALAKLRPLNLYGWTKHLFDRRVAQLRDSGAPSPPVWIGLKFFNVYGPNEYHKGDQKSVVAGLYPRVSAGEPARLFKSYLQGYADGGQLRDFVSVRDCCRVILWGLTAATQSGVFNVGTGQARSFADLARCVFAAIGREPVIEYIDMPESLRPRYQYFTRADMTRLRAAGYTLPFQSLEDGVRDYVTGYLGQPDPYR